MRRTGYYKVKLLIVHEIKGNIYTEIMYEEAPTKKEVRKIISSAIRAGMIPMRVTEHDRNSDIEIYIEGIAKYISPYRAKVIIRTLTDILNNSKRTREWNDLQYNASYIYEHISHLLIAEDREAFEDVAYSWK